MQEYDQDVMDAISAGLSRAGYEAERLVIEYETDNQEKKGE